MNSIIHNKGNKNVFFKMLLLIAATASYNVQGMGWFKENVSYNTVGCTVFSAGAATVNYGVSLWRGAEKTFPIAYAFLQNAQVKDFRLAKGLISLASKGGISAIPGLFTLSAGNEIICTGLELTGLAIVKALVTDKTVGGIVRGLPGAWGAAAAGLLSSSASIFDKGQQDDFANTAPEKENDAILNQAKTSKTVLWETSIRLLTRAACMRYLFGVTTPAGFIGLVGPAAIQGSYFLYKKYALGV